MDGAGALYCIYFVLKKKVELLTACMFEKYYSFVTLIKTITFNILFCVKSRSAIIFVLSDPAISTSLQ